MNAVELSFLGLVAFAAVGLGFVIFFGTRARRAQELEGEALTVEQVRQALSRDLLPGPLVWGVWQGLLSAGAMCLRVRDGQGQPVANISYHALPMDGVRQSFDMADRRYECVSRGVLSGRSLLRDAQSGEILFSCEHRAFRLRFFRGDSDELLFELTGLTVFHPHARLMREGREVGRLLRLNEGAGAPVVLTLAEPGTPSLALCFVLLSPS